MGHKTHSFSFELETQNKKHQVILKVEATISHWYLPAKLFGDDAHPEENEWNYKELAVTASHLEEDGTEVRTEYTLRDVPVSLMCDISEHIDTLIEKL